MSTRNFPFHNEHSHDDLPPEHGADAAHDDADALDALLNEIAQGHGFQGTRSGTRHDRPDDLNEDREPTSAEADRRAARAFHQRFAAAQARETGAAALDPTLWEQIMNAPSMEPARSVGNPWTGAAATARPPKSRPAGSLPRPSARGWAGFANATLAVVILLAGFGMWRAYDGFNSGGSDDPQPTVPGLAAQASTPEATGESVVAPPLSTPEPAYACDFSADIPIFRQVDESPIEGTALLLTTTGNLVLVCPEEPEPVLLASGLDGVWPERWPGVVSGSSGMPEDGNFQSKAINITTGQIAEIQGSSLDMQATGFDERIQSPWILAPSVDDPAAWAITDVRTMESRLLSDVLGITLPQNARLIVSESGSGAIAIGIDPLAAGNPRDPLQPGDVAIIDTSLDAPRWITLPEGIPLTHAMLFAPDGQHLAIRNSTGGSSSTVITVISASDGSEVAQSEGVMTAEPSLNMAWAQGGKALVFVQDSHLGMLRTTGDTQPVTLLESTDQLGHLRNTYDPDVVTVVRNQAEEVATETPELAQPRMYSVNTATGNVITIDGVDVHETYGWAFPSTHYLVLADTWIRDSEPAIYHVVDAATGEESGTLTDVTLPDSLGLPGLGYRSLVASNDGSTEVIGFGSSQLYLVRYADGEPDVRQLTSPPGVAEANNLTVDLSLSSDGSMLSLTINGDESRTRWLLPLDGESDTWIEVPSTVAGTGSGPIRFVAGTGE